MSRYHTAAAATIRLDDNNEAITTRVVTIVLDQPCADPACRLTHATYPSESHAPEVTP